MGAADRSKGRARILQRMGRLGEALADTAVAIRLTTDLGDHYTLSVALFVRSDIHESRGEQSEALACRDRELALVTALGNRRHAASCQAARARLLSAVGHASAATVAAEQALTEADAADDDEFVREIRQLVNRFVPAPRR